MENPIKQAIDNIDRAIQLKEVELEQLRQTRAQLAGTDKDLQLEPTSEEWKGKGITAATILLLQEKNAPAGTREIADEIRRRGVRTTSKNYVATVYATLKNAQKTFARTKDGTWELVKKKK